MFGYILPEKAHLYMKDFEMYRNFYCGICKSMGRQFSEKARFTINYDITFLAILTHNFLGVDVTYEKLKCVTKPFNKTRMMVAQNELTDKFAALNVILSYYKLVDDEIDEKKKTSKKLARKLFSKSKKKADKVLPKISKIIERGYDDLRTLERERADSVDKVAHPFAYMMRSIAEELLGEKNEDNFLDLCYNVGKWIYLIDAMDDYDEDKSEGKYNPFIYAYGGLESRQELLEKFGQEVGFTFSSILNRIIETFEKVKFSFNKDIIQNVIYKGIPLMTKGILRGEKCNRNYLKF